MQERETLGWRQYAAKSDAAQKTAPRDRAQIIDALSRLPARQRAVLYRAYYLGRTTGQIATALNVPECVVKSTLHHAVHALWVMLEDE